jgi:phosphinothricin acetyltransferase
MQDIDKVVIRPARTEDAAGIIDIYNYYVKNTHHTFETEPIDVAEMESRIKEYGEEFPFLVAEEEGTIHGYAYATHFRTKHAYDYSAEVLIYVRNESKEKKIGTRLYVRLFDQLAETNIHAIVASIALPNDPSILFHERLGFEKVAHFKEVGYKLGRWVDVGYWELINRS